MSFPRDGLYLYDFDLNKTQKTQKKNQGIKFTKSRRDPYRLIDMLRYNFPEGAFYMLSENLCKFPEKNRWEYN